MPSGQPVPGLEEPRAEEPPGIWQATDGVPDVDVDRQRHRAHETPHPAPGSSPVARSQVVNSHWSEVKGASLFANFS
jgi:hypothetical protein